MQSVCAGARIEKTVRELQVTLTLRRSPNIIYNILQLVPDFIVMRTSQQEVTYSFTFLITVTHWRFP